MNNYFIVNPKAGHGGHLEEFCENIKRICEEKAVTYKIYMTKSVGDATDFVRGICADSSRLPARFYACGGDGTLCEVANGAIGTKGAEVGLIPIGTGNDFARNFSNGESFFDVAAQLEGKSERLDILRYNGSFAVNMINVGFDCEVVKKKEKLQQHKFLPSKLAYILGLIITLVKKPGMKAAVFADGKEISDKSFLLSTFANGSFCGGGFKSNPRASVLDGKVDALFVRNIPRLKFLSLVGSYQKGTHLVPKNDKILFAQKVSSLLLKFPQKQSISVDGEVLECEELLIECVNNGMDFVVPRGSSLIGKPVTEEEPAMV